MSKKRVDNKQEDKSPFDYIQESLGGRFFALKDSSNHYYKGPYYLQVSKTGGTLNSLYGNVWLETKKFDEDYKFLRRDYEGVETIALKYRAVTSEELSRLEKSLSEIDSDKKGLRKLSISNTPENQKKLKQINKRMQDNLREAIEKRKKK
jgi:hypothetical protein